MSEELKPAAVHDANVFLPGSLGPVRREVVLAYEHDRVVNQLRAELAALKAGQGEAVAFDYPEFHAQGMGCGLEDRGIADRYEAMEYGFREGVYQTAMTIESMGPLYTAPPASTNAVSVPVKLLELEWLEGWLRFAAEPIGQECCGRGRQECCGCPDPVYPCLEDVGRAMDERAKELRALLAQSESEGVKS